MGDVILRQHDNIRKTRNLEIFSNCFDLFTVCWILWLQCPPFYDIFSQPSIYIYHYVSAHQTLYWDFEFKDNISKHLSLSLSLCLSPKHKVTQENTFLYSLSSMFLSLWLNEIQIMVVVFVFWIKLSLTF